MLDVPRGVACVSVLVCVLARARVAAAVHAERVDGLREQQRRTKILGYEII